MLSSKIVYSSVSLCLSGLQSLASTFPVRSSDRLLQNRISSVERWTRPNEDESNSESEAEAKELAQSSDSAVGKHTAAREIGRPKKGSSCFGSKSQDVSNCVLGFYP